MEQLSLNISYESEVEIIASSAFNFRIELVKKIGVDGGTGHAIEFRGDVFKKMSMEGRMTVCNFTEAILVVSILSRVE